MIACWLGPHRVRIVNIRIRRLHGWPSRDKAGLIRYKNANRMEGELQDSIACTHCQEGACTHLHAGEPALEGATLPQKADNNRPRADRNDIIYVHTVSSYNTSLRARIGTSEMRWICLG